MLTQHIDARFVRVSYCSIVPCTVVRVRARSTIFTTCGIFTVYTTSKVTALSTWRRLVRDRKRVTAYTVYVAPYFTQFTGHEL